MGGELDPLKITKKNYKKVAQDNSFSKVDVDSEKLGKISIFGVFDGNGPQGKQVSILLKNYFQDYFIQCKELNINSKKIIGLQF
jgi:hypothetical protein